MSKPVLKKVPAREREAVKRANLKTKRIRDENGEIRTVYWLDAGSGHFDVHFSKAFRLSVAKARKENKRVTGSSDVARPKE